MSEYRALAIRYRPKRLCDLTGHEGIVGTLSNAINLNRFHHAILLTGTRGVGKTTIARVLAISLNCSANSSPTATPCLQCNNCQEIINGTHPDVIEFDAASHTGVDSIREVIESCSYHPMSGRYKIYIIDEVHMLSKGAFNALLKTIEEPYDHVKFFFATTEIKKVPITILSRCQKFFLKNLSVQNLQNHVIDVCKKEGFCLEDEAAKIVATVAKGSVRDALSILDQVLLTIDDNEKTVTAKMVNSSISAPEDGLMLQLFEFLIAKNLPKAMEIIGALSATTQELDTLLVFLMNVILQFAKKISLGIEMNSDLEQIFLNYKTSVNITELMRMWQLLVKFKSVISKADLDFVVAAEMLAIQMVHLCSLPTSKEILNEMAKAIKPTLPSDEVG